jgi:hypothetical protein
MIRVPTIHRPFSSYRVSTSSSGSSPVNKPAPYSGPPVTAENLDLNNVVHVSFLSSIGISIERDSSGVRLTANVEGGNAQVRGATS